MNTTKRSGDTMTAEEFRAILGFNGLNQREAAVKLGFSRVTINEWYNGKRPIRPANVSHIRRVLKRIQTATSC